MRVKEDIRKTNATTKKESQTLWILTCFTNNYFKCDYSIIAIKARDYKKIYLKIQLMLIEINKF